MEILYQEDMSKHTSFKTGGKADFFIKVKTEEEIKQAIQFSKEKNIPLYVIGNGSNLLVKDNGIRGVVLKIELDDVYIENKKDFVMATVGAGVKMMALAFQLEKMGISGFEELAGIPGTIGGANFMNAGAYGKEMKDIIVETKCMNFDGDISTFKNEDQDLVYRGSIFKNHKFIILQTKLRLNYADIDTIKEKMDEYAKQRKEKQPLEFPSAGSTFKRGEGFITAKLIDECGLKGFNIGGAEISTKHAGFIINKGNATSKDILDLIDYTKCKVFEKFHINIEEEIEIIGK